MPVARRATFVAILATIVMTSTAAAQHKAMGFAQGDRPLVGPQIGYGTNSTKFFIGAQFAYPIVNRVDIYPDFQYFFPGHSLHFWSFDAMVRYWPKLNMKDSGLYAGGGLNISHASVSGFPGSTNAGLSLLGGWQFHTVSKILPFAQIKVVLADGSRVDFGGGINFKL